MANYGTLWEAFASGEGMEGYDALSGTETDYKQRTQAFYDQILGPTFYGDEGKDMGSGDYNKYIASFSTKELEKAEATFRTAIGDPYTSVSDPFSWEKISRYDTSGGLEGRLQSLLEKELYSKGKHLGGKVGETYETDTSKTLQGFKEGVQGQRESISHGALTSGQSLASGTSGATIRSGGNIGVAEDALTDIYKKTKTLGSEYRAGKESDERSLESDLDAALTSYISAIDSEKDRWYQAVIQDVQKVGKDFTPEEIENRLAANQEWDCGIGKIASGTDANGKTICVDDPNFTATEGAFRGNVCPVGQLWDGEQCVEMEGLDFTRDKWGLICDGEVDECGVCGGDGSSCKDCAGVPNGSAVVDDCGVCNGNNACLEDKNGTIPEGGKNIIDTEGEMDVRGTEINDIETNWENMLSDISNYWDNTSDMMQDIHDSLPVLEKPTGSGFRGKGSSTWTNPLTPEQGQVEKEKRDRERRNRSQYSRSGRRTSRNIYNFFNTPAQTPVQEEQVFPVQEEQEEEFERPWYEKTGP
tara:strand:- start:4916 stop:6502 length:1587 start_codon:yes stop_codon:yes gene_type:complete